MQVIDIFSHSVKTLKFTKNFLTRIWCTQLQMFSINKQSYNFLSRSGEFVGEHFYFFTSSCRTFIPFQLPLWSTVFSTSSWERYLGPLLNASLCSPALLEMVNAFLKFGAVGGFRLLLMKTDKRTETTTILHKAKRQIQIQVTILLHCCINVIYIIHGIKY